MAISLRRLSLFLLSLVTVLPLSTTTTPSPPLSLSPILSSLGFPDLALSATNSSATWHGPVTIFAPSHTSLRSPPLLLEEHTLPGLFPLPYLRSLTSGTTIEALASGRCLTITHSSTKVFVCGIEIILPNVHSDSLVIIHVISGYLPHYPCSHERATSLSFSPNQFLPLGFGHGRPIT